MYSFLLVIKAIIIFLKYTRMLLQILVTPSITLKKDLCLRFSEVNFS